MPDYEVATVDLRFEKRKNPQHAKGVGYWLQQRWDVYNSRAEFLQKDPPKRVEWRDVPCVEAD